jgi:hypothetical protein
MKMNLYEAAVDLSTVSCAVTPPERANRNLWRLSVLAPLSFHPSLQPPREPAAHRGGNPVPHGRFGNRHLDRPCLLDD